MSRYQSLVAMLGLAALLTVGAAPATAQTVKKPQKKKAPEPVVTTVFGTIGKVSDDGKTFTVTPMGGTKKLPTATAEFKLTERTTIEFVGIDSKEAQKLAAGYAVIVVLDPKDKGTALVIKAAQTAPTSAKKKTDK